MQNLHLEIYTKIYTAFLLRTTHYPWFKGLGSLLPISSMHQIYRQFNSTLR